MRKRLGNPAGQHQRGGGGFFAFVFILIVAAAVALYFFYYLPGLEKKKQQDESKPISAKSGNGQPKPPANQPDSNANANTNAPENNANQPENAPENNANENTPPNNTPAPETNQDEQGTKLIEAGEALLSGDSPNCREASRKGAEALKLRLSAEVRERAAKLQSTADAWAELDNVKSIRGVMLDTEPVPVRLILMDGASLIGSIPKKTLDDIYSKSRADGMPSRLGLEWGMFTVLPAARDIPGEFVLAREIGGYEAILFADLNQIRPHDNLDKYYEESVRQCRDAYDKSEKSPEDTFLHALQLKRYAPQGDSDHDLARQAKGLIEEALQADPMLAFSAKLERDKDYQEYRRICDDDAKAERAGKLLKTLLARHPFARQLAEARGQSEDEAREAMKRKVADQAAAGARAAGEGKVQAGSKALKDALDSPKSELLDRAKEFIAKAKKFDDSSMPGAPNFRQNLDQAIFHYHAAKQLLEKAGDSDEAERLRIDVNKSLFWCNKRHPIF